MIRVAILADTHANERSRWDEHCRVMDWCANDFDERGVDLVGHAGDVYETASTPTERLFVADWFIRVAQRRPVVVVAGNHDRRLDICHIGRLRGAHPIIADEAPAVRVVGGCAVATLPWPSKANLLASLGAEVSREESSAIASDHLRNIVRGLGDQLERWASFRDADAPKILLTHAMIDGAKTNHDQPLVAQDMAVSAQDLAMSRAHFVGVGHVHAENQWDVGGIPVVYANTIRHTDFGTAGPTGYVIAEFGDRGQLIRWYRVPTPASAMLLFEAEWWEDRCGYALAITGKAFPHASAIPSAEIRLRYTVASDQREPAKRAALELRNSWLAAGAKAVKVEEEVTVTTRARAPEIALARTLPEKLEAYWAAKNTVPDPARRERLLGKLSELEGASS